VIQALVPAVGSGGRPGEHSRREIVNAIFYLVRAGCSWRQLPHDLPRWAAVLLVFQAVARRRHRGPDSRPAAVHDGVGPDPMTSAAIVDTPSVKGADTVGAETLAG
jgi:transposase